MVASSTIGGHMSVEKQSDLSFLKEMREKLQSGWDNKDPTSFEFGMTMIQDWIDELEFLEGQQS
jgi:hypothetical protein